MRDAIGKRIKFYRIKKKMTQEELASGIVSISYLSKIESETVNPSAEIIGLLCNRLEIDPSISQGNNILSTCTDWFRTILDGDIKEATSKYSTLLEAEEEITDVGLIQLVEIHKLHYYTLIGNSEMASEQYHYLKETASFFSMNEYYYWLKFSGNYFFSKIAYHKALANYKEAEAHIHHDLYFKEDEVSDLYYLISVTSSKLHQFHSANLYANRALSYYQSIYHLKRCAQCHLLLGISYSLIKDNKLAIESFELAMKISSSIQNERLLSLSNQNLGDLYFTEKNYETAAEYYVQSYRMRELSPLVQKLIPICSLMHLYYHIGDTDKANYWNELGLQTAESLSPTDTFDVFKLRVYAHLINGYGKDFENLVTKEVIPFLEEKHLLKEKTDYLIILADYYFHNRKYKLAAINYSKANQVIKML